MAEIRKNQSDNLRQATEAVRDTSREAANQTQDAALAGAESLKRIADQFGRAFGLAGDNEEVARQASQNLQAITETGSVLVRGLQEVSKEWLELAQQRFQKNAEGITRLAQSRTVQDLAAAQTDLVRENLQQIVEGTRKIAERSIQVADDAARALTTQTETSSRLRRAA